MDVLRLTHDLAEAGEAFVVATVVRCEPPASARPGAKAVIRVDGSMESWVGGICAQPMVIREAQHALQDGTPRLVRLSPHAGAGGRREPGLAEYLMTCHSGGTLEIFVEPVVPAPRLYLVGETPITQTLATLGPLVGFRVERIAATADGSGAPALADLAPGRETFVVVATMGTADEEALEAALRGPAPYVALVASPRRAEVLRDYLLARGLTADRFAKLKAPAGLDIGAATPEAIALSIMAEIVQVRTAMKATARTLHANADSPVATSQPDEATDPVCGMSVVIADARFTTEFQQTTYYFCCPHCRAKFEAEPLAFVGAPTASA